MNNSAAITNITAANGHVPIDAAIDGALNVLIEAGITFEVVARCPSECGFCDEALSTAA